MAINTANRRRSASSTGPWRRLAPLPDGSISSVADRQQIAGRYRGIEASSVVVADATVFYSVVGLEGFSAAVLGQEGLSVTVRGLE